MMPVPAEGGESTDLTMEPAPEYAAAGLPEHHELVIDAPSALTPKLVIDEPTPVVSEPAQTMPPVAQTPPEPVVGLEPTAAPVEAPAPVVVTPQLIQPEPPKPAEATAPATSAEPAIPKLEPGEVFVDELGNVHTGE